MHSDRSAPAQLVIKDRTAADQGCTATASELHALHRERSESAQGPHSERPETAQGLHNDQASTLRPAAPPGRSTRKARAFTFQMRELRAQGYTFEAIRQALASAGVHVSNATVQRELRRAVRARLMPLPAQTPSPKTPHMADPTAAVRPIDPRSGKEIAEAFHAQHVSNPLLRVKHAAKDAQ